MNIAFSTISYYQEEKPTSKIYSTFAKRLANDVLTKTPYDFFINTNRKDFFEELTDTRVKVRDWFLKDHKTRVGPFNQLLKFSAIKDIDDKYDWVIYFDCDAGVRDVIDTEKVEKFLNDMYAQGYEMGAIRTNATYLTELTKEREIPGENHLFSKKFKFYGIDESLIGSCFPSEHFFVVKNGPKLKLMAEEFEKFCYQFETQDLKHPITFDMEAYEIGVSAFKAGIKVFEVGWGNHIEIFNCMFNGNNKEKVKY